jgi:hypothetical protein
MLNGHRSVGKECTATDLQCTDSVDRSALYAMGDRSLCTDSIASLYPTA